MNGKQGNVNKEMMMKNKTLMIFAIFLFALCLSSCGKQITDGDFVFRKGFMEGYVLLLRYTGNESLVEVPKSVDNYPVRGTSQDEVAFKDLPNLEQVKFLGDETNFYYTTFENCPKLHNVIITGNTGLISNSAVKNCPSLSVNMASSGGATTTSTKSGAIGTWKKQYARYEGKRIDESKLASGVYVPNEFNVYSGGTASANKFNFSWSGSGSNVKFTYNGSGNVQAQYDAANNQMLLGFATIYQGQPAFIVAIYK
jgi:hypothetical protein